MAAPSEGSLTSGTALSDERGRILRYSVALFLFTFLVYWLAGPMKTAYDFQLSQANNLIHGHLDMDPQYTHNLNVLERVLFDGKGFCLPLDDPRAAQQNTYTIDVEHTASCLQYMQHSLGPAFLLAPLALIFGLTVNQTMVSAFIGALAAPVVWGITRKFTDHLPTQLALTALAMFGTTLMYSASDGSVWHFAHTTAVFFTFSAIYATVVLRNPLLAGALVGAAFMCRPTAILAGVFPLVAFADQWLVAASSAASGLWRRVRDRIRLRPLVELAVGVAPFILLTMVVNSLRFGKPFESGYSYTEQIYQSSLAWVYVYGVFDPRYITRHVVTFWEQMPHFSEHGPYVWPSWAGQAMWAVSPALLIGLFAHLRRYQRTALAVVLGIAAAATFLVVSAAATDLGLADVGPDDVPFGLQLAPFWILVVAAIGLAIYKRDRLVIACWAAIVPLVMINWVFAATGWAQFGYRYGLDFMPFLFMLVVLAVRRVRWYHAVLIGVSILINLWGMLWIFKFAPAQLFGWTWVSY
jgi:hypothetical protein